MQAQPARKHRSRTHPMPSGKRNTITENDLRGIFEPLSRYQQLTTKQIVAFGSRYPTKTRNRLTDLYHEAGDWLVRLSENVRFANHLFMDELYSLGDEAEQLLETRGIVPPETWLRAARVGGHSSMPSTSSASRTTTWPATSRSTSRSARDGPERNSAAMSIC